MMFLIRVAFWLCVVIVLLPTPPSQTVESKVGATQMTGAASAAVSDTRAFCTRQPDACEVGSQAITAFGYKAQASAKWVYEFLSAKLGSEHNSAAPAAAAAPADVAPSQNTLTPSDAAPAWRGPRQAADARR